MDKYINATNLIKNIDTALAKTPPRGNGKSTEVFSFAFLLIRFLGSMQ